MYDDLTTLNVDTRDGVAWVTINNPPVNMLDTALIGDLSRFVTAIRDDAEIRVVVLQSANPEFFLAHVDFSFMEHPEDFAALSEIVPGDGTLTPMQSLVLALKALPQLTIAKLRGRLRGGGNEIALAADLRYAAIGETWLSQVESRIGIIPGGGGSTLLAALVGPARALEIVLGGDLYDAATAAHYGWVNLAIEPTALDDYVDGFALRVARRTPPQIAAAKAVTATVSLDDIAAGFRAELAALGTLYPAPDLFVEQVRRAVADGAQTREGELDLEGALERAAHSVDT